MCHVTADYNPAASGKLQVKSDITSESLNAPNSQLFNVLHLILKLIHQNFQPWFQNSTAIVVPRSSHPNDLLFFSPPLKYKGINQSIDSYYKNALNSNPRHFFGHVFFDTNEANSLNKGQQLTSLPVHGGSHGSWQRGSRIFQNFCFVLIYYPYSYFIQGQILKRKKIIKGGCGEQDGGGKNAALIFCCSCCSLIIDVKGTNFLNVILQALSTQEESQRMIAVRKVYQKAIVTPTHHIEQLWKEYENFENSVSRQLVTFRFWNANVI